MVFQKEYASVYDILYFDKNYEKECDFIKALFDKYECQPKTILDLGCGTGKHALILAENGYKVTGIDRSSFMLEIAKKKAKSKGLDVEFIKGDLTSIVLNRRFDAVLSMFAVMGYQVTNQAVSSVCKLAKESLIPGGLFIFDCWYGPAVLTNKPTIRIKEISSKNNDRVIRLAEPELSMINHTVKVKYRVLRVKNGKFTEALETHIVRFFFPQEVRYFLEVAGFRTVDFYPFLELNRDLTENDWNMMVAVK